MESANIYVGVDPSMSTGIVCMLKDTMEVFRAEEVELKNRMKSTTEEILQYGRDIVNSIPKHAIVCIEGFSLASKGQAVSYQFGIGFSIRFALIDAGLQYIEVTPSGLKKFVAGKGKGNAKKEIIIKEVYKRWGYEHDSNNVIDAYALARYALAQGE